MYNLSIHGAHNATVAISFEGTVLEAVEIERLTSSKNDGLFWGASKWIADTPEEHHYGKLLLEQVRDYFAEKYKVDRYDNLVYNSIPFEGRYVRVLESIFTNVNQYTFVPHHLAHAANGLYQSPFDEALIITFDGGSDSGFFNIWHGDKRREQVFKHLYQGKTDLSVAYSTPGNFTAPIRLEKTTWIGNLVYPGKLMGLAAFGKRNQLYEDLMLRYYRGNFSDHVDESIDRFLEQFKHAGFTRESRVDGQLAADLAAANQRVFELLFRAEIDPFMQLYPNLPLVLGGGGALNILNNTRMRLERPVFVGPTPNDTGLAVGMLCWLIKPSTRVDVTYLGPEAWDKLDLGRHIRERECERVTIEAMRDRILDGKIIGVVRGRSEHGARALGNRSIICNPAFKDMKDLLNEKIKQREFYRPFAPVVRLEDVSKYFEWEGETRWMSFSPKVRDEWRDRLQAITHADGTARVQTVTREQNPFIYDLLTALAAAGAPGVLLNTSFNIAGKPILNTYKDAFKLFDETQMDGLILEDIYFPKQL